MSATTGKIKWFNEKKGFGFITTGNQDIWFHATSVSENGPVLKPDDNVSFDIEEHTKGKRAKNVKRI